MGFFSSVGSFFSGAVSAIGGALSSLGSAFSSGLSSLCSAIGGTALGSALTGVVSKLTGALGVVIPGLNVFEVIILAVQVVSKIAEALGLKDKEKDHPDELAMKAEKDDKKPEDYESTEAYIKHLHEDIELSKEEKEKLNKMSPEERAAYHMTGTYLYLKGINEKLGLDKEGLKNPELIGITGEVLADFIKLGNIFEPGDLVVYTKHLQAQGASMQDFSNYLHGKSDDIKMDKKVQDAIVGAATEIDPSMSESDIDDLIDKMNIED